MSIPAKDLSKRFPFSGNTMIILIGIATLFTRFYHIEKDSLWLDEAVSLSFATEPFWDMLSFAYNDPALPLFPITLFFWLKIFGTGILAARSISAVFSILNVILVFQTIRKLFDKNTALVTAIIFILTPFQVYYAQELRVYSMLQFLGLVSVNSFIHLLDKFKPARAAIYIVASSLILYAHVYGWFLLLFQWFWAFFIWRNGRISRQRFFHILFSGCAVITLFLPYSLSYFRMIFDARNAFWIERPNFIHLAGMFEQYTGYLPLFIILIPFILITLFLFIQKKIREKMRRHILFLIFWAAFPVFLPFIISHLVSPMFQVRYTIFAAVPFYALIAIGINQISRPRPFRFSLLLVIVFSVIGLQKHYSAVTREPWDQVVIDLNTESLPNDPILVGADFCYQYPFLYYGKNLATRTMGLSKTDVKNHEKIRKFIKKIQFDANSIWFVSSHFNANEKNVLTFLETLYKQRERFVYYYRDLYDRDIPGIIVYHLSNPADK